MNQLHPIQANPLAQLVIMRVREFVREPEAIFWVYVFPILMMIALGVAFRERPVETSAVAVQQGPTADHVASVLDRDAYRQNRLDRRASRFGQINRLFLRSNQIDQRSRAERRRRSAAARRWQGGHAGNTKP